MGGFVGVPGMIYVLGAPGLVASATELVIAFVMGLGGTIKCAMSGLVDIRLAMMILAGSLFGIQLGAIGTTYVKPYMIKVVMGDDHADRRWSVAGLSCRSTSPSWLTWHSRPEPWIS